MMRPRFSMSCARWVVFVPGAAHASAIVWPGRGSRRCAISIEASSWIVKAPSAKARQDPGIPPCSIVSPSGAYGVAATASPSSVLRRSARASRVSRKVFARTVSGGRSFIARINAAASSTP